MRLQNGADFTGNATLSSSSSILSYEHNSTLTSGRSINLANSGAALSIARNTAAATDSTLTIASGASVRGFGAVTSGNFSGGSTNTIVNNGLISSDVAASTLTLNPDILINNNLMQAINGATLSISAASFTNNGTVNGNASPVNIIPSVSWSNTAGHTISVNGATLTLGGTWSNAGTLSVNNATLNMGGTFTTAGINLPNFAHSSGTVNLTGTLNNTGTVLALNANTGSWRLFGGTINGGSITRSGGADLIFTSSSGILNGTSIIGDISLSDPAARVRLQNGADFTGNATLSTSSSILSYEYNFTLPSGRSINLANSGTALSIGRNTAAATDSTFTIASGASVRGVGTITSSNFSGGSTNTVLNNGLISADVPASTLTTSPDRLVNNNVVQAINGATLSFGSGSFTNNGTVLAGSGGKVINSILTGNAGRIVSDGTGSLVRLGSGTLAYTLNQPVAVTNRATLNLQGNWTRSADIDASGRIIFDYPTAGPSPFAAIRAAIISGRNGGAWNGPGINSSAAAATPGTGVGYAEASNVLTASGGSFSGENVDGTAVLVRYTYLGDATLDGQVDVSDLGTARYELADLIQLERRRFQLRRVCRRVGPWRHWRPAGSLAWAARLAPAASSRLSRRLGLAMSRFPSLRS